MPKYRGRITFGTGEASQAVRDEGQDNRIDDLMTDVAILKGQVATMQEKIESLSLPWYIRLWQAITRRQIK